MRQPLREEISSFDVPSYLADRTKQIAFWLAVVAALAGVLYVCGLNAHAIGFVCVFVTLAFAVVLAWDYLRKRTYYRELADLVDSLDQARYVPSLLHEPTFLEGLLVQEALELQSKKASDELVLAQEHAHSYQEYVESWVHEAKTPIAAAKLVLARMKGPDATVLRQEVETMERQVEQALYYARSETLSQDLLIKQMPILDCVREAAKRNQNLLISSGVRPVFDVPADLVGFADESWLLFVLGQLFANSAKYGAREIRISARLEGEGTSGHVTLEVADDGIGIPAADMPRIFQHGFVGKNGRELGSATGMGLYLCARLCLAMGLGIDAYSEEGHGTRFVLTLPTNQRLIDLTRA